MPLAAYRASYEEICIPLEGIFKWPNFSLYARSWQNLSSHPPYSSQCRKHSFSLLVFFSIQKLIYDYEDKRRFAFVDGLLLLLARNLAVTKVLLEHKGLVEFIIPCTASICHPRELKT
jgi:hypothetical protein